MSESQGSRSGHKSQGDLLVTAWNYRKSTLLISPSRLPPDNAHLFLLFLMFHCFLLFPTDTALFSWAAPTTAEPLEQLHPSAFVVLRLPKQQSCCE